MSVMLDQQKGWNESHCEKPYPQVIVVQTPFSVVRINRRHLRPATSPGRCEMPDEQDLDLEPETQAGDPGSESSHTEPDQLLQIVKPCRVVPAVPSSAKTQSSLPQRDVRTSSGRVARKPVRFRDFV